MSLKEFNVLVLGPTGVGKSTWINAIANYLTFKDLAEASLHELIMLVPTKFKYVDHKGRRHVIETGKDQNECFEEGKQATKSPRAYEFLYNEHLYRIIDTPGIGNVDGIEVDKQNMANIIQFVERFKYLNAICILLPPNESLSEHFLFCFKELLVPFHRSAATNIIFCFTNTAGHGFRAQVTLAQLDFLLTGIRQNQHIDITYLSRSFSFDNMAYRYLCMKNSKNNITFDDFEMKYYQLSFNHSKTSTINLFEYISKLDPHNAIESVQLCSVRNILFGLTGPLAAIRNVVRETSTVIKECLDDLETYENNEKMLCQKLMKTIFTDWTVEEKDFCRNCSYERSYIGEDRLKLIECDPSLQNDYPVKVWVANNNLKADEQCQKCGPNTIRMTSNKVFTQFYEKILEEDKSVESRIQYNKGLQNEVLVKIVEKQQLKEEIEGEYDQILKASVECAFFIYINSIITWNDTTESYLDTLIEDERKYKYNSAKLKFYTDMRHRYIEKRLIYKRSNTVREDLEPEQIWPILENLKNLKRYGKDIEDVIQKASKHSDFDTHDEKLVHRYQPKAHHEKVVERIRKYIKSWTF